MEWNTFMIIGIAISDLSLLDDLRLCLGRFSYTYFRRRVSLALQRGMIAPGATKARVACSALILGLRVRSLPCFSSARVSPCSPLDRSPQGLYAFG